MPNLNKNFASQLIIYQTENGEIKIDVRLEHGTVWLSQKLMADLFDTTKQNVSLHLQNIFAESELDENLSVKEFLTVQNEGNRQVSRKVEFYNLDAIISVGYRIKSKTATRFRQWATKRLQEYIVKGFVLDDERLKNPDLPFDYFEELLKRIQDIRTSEKRFYRKITDIYATSVDYDPADEMSIVFFQTVQNKAHFAITGKTAAEIIYERVNSEKANMGLTNWRGEKVRKTDVGIAKNYLNEKELLALNNLVEQYLVFAEGQAMRRIPMKMKDWIQKLDGFMKLNDRDILQSKGKISHEEATKLAEEEYRVFNKNQINEYSKIDADFDNAVKLIEKKKKELK
ncbi:virulence RhuM family protein [bacterium]